MLTTEPVVWEDFKKCRLGNFTGEIFEDIPEKGGILFYDLKITNVKTNGFFKIRSGTNLVECVKNVESFLRLLDYRDKALEIAPTGRYILTSPLGAGSYPEKLKYWIFDNLEDAQKKPESLLYKDARDLYIMDERIGSDKIYYLCQFKYFYNAAIWRPIDSQPPAKEIRSLKSIEDLEEISELYPYEDNPILNMTMA